MSDNPTDTVRIDIPTVVRLLEWAREECKGDIPIHVLTENLIRVGEGGAKTVTMSDYPNIIPQQPAQEEHAAYCAEVAADAWWDSLTKKEKKAYVLAHPKSKYAKQMSSPEHILGQHGWVKKGKRTFYHPKSRRKFYLRPSDTHKHHVVVTHPGGYISQKLTNSDATLSRFGKRMARPAGAGISAALRDGQGSLHRVLGVEHGKPLPLGKLAKLAKSDHPLAGRARLVLNLKRAKKRGGAEIFEAQRSVR